MDLGTHEADRRGPYVILVGAEALDVDTVHSFLSACYWSPGIARSRIERAVGHSLCFGVYDTRAERPAVAPGVVRHAQVGFARVVSDFASFAYLCDVFVLDAHRGKGLGVWLMETVMAHPDLRGVRRFCLMTRDAHGLYSKFGFTPMPDPTRYMERVDRESYRRD